jgi:hypothetical protein
MPLVRINTNPSGRQLLVFSLAWIAALAALGFASWHRGRVPVAGALWALALAVPLAGAAYRPLLRGAFLGLSYATYPVGWVVSHVVLALLYFLVLTPVGLTMRMLGHDPLARTFDRGARTYWIPRDPKRTPESYFNQS